MGLVLPVNGHWLGLGAALRSQNKLALQEQPRGCHGELVCVLGAEGLQQPAAEGSAVCCHSALLSERK